MLEGVSPELQTQLDAQKRWPDHRIICTFAFKLPYALRLPDGSTFMMVMSEEQFSSPEDAAVFGEQPWVRVRLHNHPFEGIDAWPNDASDVLRDLYGVGVERPDSLPLWAAGEAYEQWVSLETPSGRLVGENEDDQAYHFHRCLRYLDVFVQSHMLAFRDSRVHPISTPELSPLVFVGKYELGEGDWALDIAMLTHPEAMPEYTEHVADESHIAVLESALIQLRVNNPFVTATFLALRADDAHRVRGDFVDAVVSMETAMESRLFALWRCLLVDLGYTDGEISTAVTADTPYRTLLVTTLPTLLGGRWDVSAIGTPVGNYWSDLYELRNRIVHAGYRPNIVEADRAKRAHDALRRFIRERLWERRSVYLRTVALYVSPDVMEQFGWEDAGAKRRAEKFQQEPAPFFAPWDIAGRDPPAKPPKPLRPGGRR